MVSLSSMKDGGLALGLWVVVLFAFQQGANAKAILGVDMGSFYMKVALVQRGAPLEIVTNMHSKRKTEVMVLFDGGARFYGADAWSLYGRKAGFTPLSLNAMLGRTDDHPAVKVLSDRHFPLTPVYNETRAGVCLKVAGDSYTPEELVAMVLDHAVTMTQQFVKESSSSLSSKIQDCVLTVPSYATEHERRALKDAAELAGLNVLDLVDETTAAALHYGLDRVDVDPQLALFYNMGAGSLQVSIVKYHSYDYKETKYGASKTVGSLEVLGKGWDATLGGAAFDARLVDFMADEFNKIIDKPDYDVRQYPRPMAKLRVQAIKAKQVLSANTEIGIHIDALHNDVTYKSKLTRAQFDSMCADLLERSIEPIRTALRTANVTLSQIDFVELIGGGMRVPAVQRRLTEFFTDKLELGLHLNSDESMALGAAFHGANVSTAFKVRRVGLTDVNPFPVQVELTDLPFEEDEEKKGMFGGLFAKKKKDGDIQEEEEETKEEEWFKRATLFPEFGRLGTKKTLAFTHDRDVHCAVDYVQDEDGQSNNLPEGTYTQISRYNVTGISKFAKEMANLDKKPKITLQFEMSSSGISGLVKAEATVEETVTVTEEIEVEVDDDEETEEETTNEEEESSTTNNTDEDSVKEESTDAEPVKSDEEESKEAETKTETKETDEKEKKTKTKKRKEKKTVEKEKKKVHRRTLKVDTYYVGRIQPHSAALMEESKAKLQALADQDKERQLLEEARNQLESYIYFIKNKLADEADDIAKVTTESQRNELLQMAVQAEEWLYEEGYDATRATYDDQHAGLYEPAQAVFLRQKESVDRPAAVKALRKKLDKVTDLVAKWQVEKPWITDDERQSVSDEVDVVHAWLNDAVARQEAVPSHEPPAFFAKDLPAQIKTLESLVSKLNKKKKPKEEKKEEPSTKEEKPANDTEPGTDTADTDSETGADDTDESSEETETAEETTTPPEEEASSEESKEEDTSDTNKDTVSDEL